MRRRQLLRGALASCGLAVLPSGLEAAGKAAGKAAGAPPPQSLDFATALEAAEAIRRRRVSSLELTRLALDRIDRYNPSLNAVVNVLRDEALAAARAADDALMASLRAAVARGDGSLETLRAHAITDGVWLVAAVKAARLRHRAVWQRYFRDHDAFLMPTAFVPAFPHDDRPMAARVLATPGGERPYEDLLFWITIPTVTGLPATTAPVGLTGEGLPVGAQIVGPYLEDATPIDVAARMADVVGGFQAPPGYA